MANNQVVVVIGSGPAGANAALTLLKKDRHVLLLDIGHEEPELPPANVNFDELKHFLPDPQSYFLGNDLSGIIPPGAKSLFAFPPSRNYKANPSDLDFISPNFEPYISHAKGGFGVAWAANAIPWDDDDLRNFPLDENEFQSHSKEAQQRMGIAGANKDNLTPFIRFSDPLRPSIELNPHDRLLYSKFKHHTEVLQNRHQLTLGVSRLAVDTDPGSKHSCTYCNRCLWGCPRNAIYSPLHTLQECQSYSKFTYRPNCRVTHLQVGQGRIIALSYVDTKSNQKGEILVDSVILGAGAISSAAIFLKTLSRDLLMRDYFQNHPLKTISVLDTLSARIPYLFLPMLGKSTVSRDYQFNKLLFRYEQRSFPELPNFIQGQVMSLSSLMYHPLINSLPLGTFYSSRIFFQLRSALGAVTFFLPDQPFSSNGISLGNQGENEAPTLKISYINNPNKEILIGNILKSTIKGFRKVGAICSKRKIEVRPNGSGIHYAGTIPMSREPHPLKLDKNGRSYLYRNLFVADGSAFPTLPSKSITFNIVAHAIRVAEKM